MRRPLPGNPGRRGGGRGDGWSSGEVVFRWEEGPTRTFALRLPERVGASGWPQTFLLRAPSEVGLLVRRRPRMGWGEGEPDAEVVPTVVGLVPVPVGDPGVPGPGVPGTAADDAIGPGPPPRSFLRCRARRQPPSIRPASSTCRYTCRAGPSASSPVRAAIRSSRRRRCRARSASSSRAPRSDGKAIARPAASWAPSAVSMRRLDSGPGALCRRAMRSAAMSPVRTTSGAVSDPTRPPAAAVPLL